MSPPSFLPSLSPSVRVPSPVTVPCPGGAGVQSADPDNAGHSRGAAGAPGCSAWKGRWPGRGTPGRRWALSARVPVLTSPPGAGRAPGRAAGSRTRLCRRLPGPLGLRPQAGGQHGHVRGGGGHRAAGAAPSLQVSTVHGQPGCCHCPLSPVPAHTRVLQTSLRFQIDPVSFFYPSIPPSLTCLPLDFVSLVPSDPECLQPGVGLEGPDLLCTPGNLPWSSGFRQCPVPVPRAALNKLSPSLTRPFILQAWICPSSGLPEFVAMP